MTNPPNTEAEARWLPIGSAKPGDRGSIRVDARGVKGQDRIITLPNMRLSPNGYWVNASNVIIGWDAKRITHFLREAGK